MLPEQGAAGQPWRPAPCSTAARPWPGCHQPRCQQGWADGPARHDRHGHQPPVAPTAPRHLADPPPTTARQQAPLPDRADRPTPTARCPAPTPMPPASKHRTTAQPPHNSTPLAGTRLHAKTLRSTERTAARRLGGPIITAAVWAAMSWWAWVLISFGVLCASWVLLVLLAARLPEGSLKELAGFLPDCVTTARRLRGDRQCHPGEVRNRVRTRLGAVTNRPDPRVPARNRSTR